MTQPIPSVGRVVHYVSHGTPPRADGSQAYSSECRAAIITEVPGGVTNPQTIGLAVLNPTGMFFNRSVPHGPTLGSEENGFTPLCDHNARAGGTWHWPERV